MHTASEILKKIIKFLKNLIETEKINTTTVALCGLLQDKRELCWEKC